MQQGEAFPQIWQFSKTGGGDDQKGEYFKNYNPHFGFIDRNRNRIIIYGVQIIQYKYIIIYNKYIIMYIIYS